MPEPKQFYFSLFKVLNRTRSIPHLIRRTGIKIIFPFYHVVSDDRIPHIQNLYQYKNVSEFKKDMEFLLKFYTPLHINDFLKNNYDPDKNYFVLSFDDGLREMYDVVYPILKHLGIPALFFLNSAFVDNKALFYRYKVSLIINSLSEQENQVKILKFLQSKNSDISDTKKYLLQLKYEDNNLIEEIGMVAGVNFDSYLGADSPYMNSQQISELLDNGFSIGGHSADHPQYNLITPEEQFSQTSESIHFLVEKFNIQTLYFAFPFSAEGVLPQVFERMFSELQLNLSFGTAGIGKPYKTKHIERIPMEVKNYTGEQIIKNEYAWYLMKKLIGRK